MCHAQTVAVSQHLADVLVVAQDGDVGTKHWMPYDHTKWAETESEDSRHNAMTVHFTNVTDLSKDATRGSWPYY